MSDFLLSALLGVIEGVTEFLPVSSTAHIRIVQYCLGLSLESEFWKLYAIFIQLGAILSVVVLFRTRLAAFLRDALARGLFRAAILREPPGLILIAFLCTCGPVFLLKKVAGKNLESMPVISWSLLVGGVVMIGVDLFFSRRGDTDSVEAMRPWQAAWIGLVQVLSAVFPGTSRSMSTIAGAQLAGLKRPAALEFSFLISIPVMAAATLYDLWKYQSGAGGPALGAREWQLLAVGFVVSFLVAYAVVAWFLGYVRNHGFVPFGLYRIALAILLLLTGAGS